MSKKPKLSFWQIWNLSFGFLGVQIGYSLQNSNTSTIFESLGADVSHLSYFWLAAPLAGMVIQPIVGMFSDGTWTRFGRRIPYILGGAFISTLALMLMPNCPTLLALAPLAMGAFILLFMDLSFNVTMQPFRALVADHTSDVLNTLKNNGVDVTWVQVGNEVTNGMLWENGRVRDQSASGFAKLFKAGADQVKAVYPNASVILHIDNAWNMDTLQWFYSLMANTGVKYDMIGLSLYPSDWNKETNSFGPWEEKVNQAVANIPQLIKSYNKDVMLVEFGMPADEPEKGKEALEALWNGLKDVKRFRGIFYWEPESELGRNGYANGAFKDGKPTVALSPFAKR